MNNVKINFIIALILLFSSCVKEERNKPKPFLDEAKMKSVFVDILLLEAQVEILNLQIDSALTLYRHLEQKKIWDKHNITKEDFKKNHDYYMLETDIYDQLFTKVVDSLGVLESEIISSGHKTEKVNTPEN